MELVHLFGPRCPGEALPPTRCPLEYFVWDPNQVKGVDDAVPTGPSSFHFSLDGLAGLKIEVVRPWVVPVVSCTLLQEEAKAQVRDELEIVSTELREESRVQCAVELLDCPVTLLEE